LHLEASAFCDQTKRTAFNRLNNLQPLGIRAITADVVRTGNPILVSESRDQHSTAAVDVNRRPPIPTFDRHSLIVAPLLANGRTLGTIVMLNAESPLVFSADDFALAKNLGSRAGLCLDEARLFEQRQHDAAFQRFIAHASEVLASSHDLQTTLDGLLRLVVPEFAQWAIVNLIDEHDGTAKAAGIIHANPQKAELANRLRGHSYLTVLDPAAPHALRTRASSQVVPCVDESYIRAVVRPEYVPTLTDIELGSSLVSVPLVAGGLLLGALTFASDKTESRHVYEESDLPLFEELARRAAVAILNARDFAHERRVSDFLQSSSLPLELPQCPGLRFHACYEAGKSDAQVGGDWYDALALADGRILIAIGDVLGSGVEAAITMASLRQIIRGAAQIDPNPSAIIEAADRALHSEYSERYATAFVGLFDPITGLLQYAYAGHPRPLLRQADGAIAELTGGRGLPLGLREMAAPEPQASVVLPPDSLLVLYTDGLTESTHDPSEGEQRLVAALGDAAVRESSNVARALQSAVLREGSRDDVAVLVLAIESLAAGVKRQAAPPTDEATLRWTFDAHDAKTARAAHDSITRHLRTNTVSDDECHDAEVVFGELLSNVVRHAPGPIEVRLEMRGETPVLHVLDQGPGFQHVAKAPVDLMSEAGRGLTMIAALSAEFNVTRRSEPLSGSHARAVLSINRPRAGAG
jgi:serine phosphatase RsbU (regulator of sigma subunit)/anti-sigma regulatory factor (Ser/Thr protein kinase)